MVPLQLSTIVLGGPVNLGQSVIQFFLFTRNWLLKFDSAAIKHIAQCVIDSHTRCHFCLVELLFFVSCVVGIVVRDVQDAKHPSNSIQHHFSISNLSHNYFIPASDKKQCSNSIVLPKIFNKFLILTE